ncbi:MAG TPA: hypothetical protein VGD53_16885 [Actinoallomurus sp.]|jgi:hypothetical protein
MWQRAGVRRALLALIVVLAVLLAGVTVAALHYQPLESAGWFSSLEVTGADGQPLAGAVTRKEGIVFPDEALATVKTLDSQIVMVFPIDNHGRYPVRVTKVLAPGDHPLFAQSSVSMGDEHGGSPSRPFRPVTLRPGDVRTIKVRARPACLGTPHTPDIRYVLSQTWVEYSFLGVHHTARIPLQSYGFAIQGIKVCD